VARAAAPSDSLLGPLKKAASHHVSLLRLALYEDLVALAQGTLSPWKAAPVTRGRGSSANRLIRRNIVEGMLSSNALCGRPGTKSPVGGPERLIPRVFVTLGQRGSLQTGRHRR
jgi:hypothetical protein